MGILLVNGSSPQMSHIKELIDGSFYHGRRVMTTMLAKKTRVVDFKRHMERLFEHAREISLESLPSAELISFEIESALETMSEPQFSRIRVILFPDARGAITRITEVENLDSEAMMSSSEGIRLSTCIERAWVRGAHIKTGLLGMREGQIAHARASGFDDILWVNGDGELAEATWANIFLIGRTGDLVEIATPPSSSGLLLGIVRRRITELLTISKIPVTERVITLEEVPRFDEAFLTSSIRGLSPVSQIGKHRLQTLRPNSVFKHICRLYESWLSSDFPNNFQILNKEPRS